MSFDSLLINTCDIGKVTRNKWNVSTRTIIYNDVKCRWEWGNREVFDSTGQRKIATATVFFKAGQDMKLIYFLKYNGREYGIIDIQEPQDSVDVHHKEVLVR